MTRKQTRMSFMAERSNVGTLLPDNGVRTKPLSCSVYVLPGLFIIVVPTQLGPSFRAPEKERRLIVGPVF